MQTHVCAYEVHEARTRESDDFYLGLLEKFKAKHPKPSKSALACFPRENSMCVVCERIIEVPFCNKVLSIMHMLKDVPKYICNNILKKNSKKVVTTEIELFFKTESIIYFFRSTLKKLTTEFRYKLTVGGRTSGSNTNLGKYCLVGGDSLYISILSGYDCGNQRF